LFDGKYEHLLNCRTNDGRQPDGPSRWYKLSAAILPSKIKQNSSESLTFILQIKGLKNLWFCETSFSELQRVLTPTFGFNKKRIN
jgi:hypothetical protein